MTKNQEKKKRCSRGRSALLTFLREISKSLCRNNIRVGHPAYADCLKNRSQFSKNKFHRATAIEAQTFAEKQRMDGAENQAISNYKLF
jgi:hypothetical protein